MAQPVKRPHSVTIYCYHCQVHGCINVHVSVYALNKEEEVKNKIEQDQVKT